MPAPVDMTRSGGSSAPPPAPAPAAATSPVTTAPPTTETAAPPPAAPQRRAGPFVDRVRLEEQKRAASRAEEQRLSGIRTAAETDRKAAEAARTEAAALAKQGADFKRIQALATKSPAAARQLMKQLGISEETLFADLTREALGEKPEAPSTDAQLAEMRAQFQQEIEALKTDEEKRWEAVEQQRQEAEARGLTEAQAADQATIEHHQRQLTEHARNADPAEMPFVSVDPDDAAELAMEITKQAVQAGYAPPTFQQALQQAEVMYVERFRGYAQSPAGEKLALEIAKAKGWTAPGETAAEPVPRAPGLTAALAASPPAAPARPAAGTPPPGAPRAATSLSNRDTTGTPPLAPPMSKQQREDGRMQRALAAAQRSADQRRALGLL